MGRRLRRFFVVVVLRDWCWRCLIKKSEVKEGLTVLD